MSDETTGLTPEQAEHILNSRFTAETDADEDSANSREDREADTKPRELEADLSPAVVRRTETRDCVDGNALCPGPDKPELACFECFCVFEAGQNA